MTDMIDDLDRALSLANAELGMLSHIDDDARRDALVSEHAEDRQAARETAADVARMKRHIDRLVVTRGRLVKRRAKAIDKLSSR